jgi:exodeoxyribonuclease VII small subunit
MSKPSKAADAARTDSLPFETAMQRLEAIVDAMESEELPLETLLAKYEEGVKLARVCQSKIADAELKIRQLEKNAAGALSAKPVAADLTEEA